MRQNKSKTENRKPKTVYAKKSFGQNFLVDQDFIDKIIAALDPQAVDTIIEIGPGRGALTEKLLEKAGRVIAVELDKDLIHPLTEKLGSRENFQLIAADALKIDFTQFANSQPPTAKSKLVANLPYNISTAILQKLIAQRSAFSEMILMFQREVVDRITAAPGNAERGFLTVLVEAYLETEKLFDVPSTAFRPAPKIWSAVARLTPKENVEIRSDELFRETVSAAFRQKRKTIFNNLKTAGGDLQKKIAGIDGGLLAALETANIEPQRRAETLTLNEWKSLVHSLN